MNGTKTRFPARWRRLAAGAAAVAIVGSGWMWNAQRDVARMAAAAEAFLSSLSAAQRSQATFPLDDDERLRWHFIPVEMYERNGVSLKDMGPTQRERAHALLRAGLSQDGYLTATQVMELEDVLKALEGGGRFARDRDDYHFSIFGTPGDRATWAWRFEGHHISLHFTIVDGAVAVSSPAFVGANPAEVLEGPQRGRRALADREDYGRALVRSLTATQRVTATIATEAPRDIVTGAEVDIDPLQPGGISARELSEPQRALLMSVIESYTSMMADEIAERRMGLLMEVGLDEVSFAWAGAFGPGQPHYYRVQGPTFLIEYDNTQNDANHIHSVWRDFDGDFGRDLLREHLGQYPH